ncbi:MAG: efflux RND transporter permease subunit [Peptostreptococcaceae bacterium]|nr:efflux RND transporter permease subunit [Peptostreptococcaceae bacterium]
MKISNLSVKRPVTVIMMMLIVVSLGFVSLSKLSIDLYPDIEVPVALVITNYSGVGPQEIESLVTEPVEESMATVNNVDRISSTSSEGSSVVVLEFDYGADMDAGTMQMREKLDLIRDFLPGDASSPFVFKIDPNAMPIITAGLSSDRGIDEIQSIAENKLKSRLERIDGVASVDISGGYEDMVRVLVNPLELDRYGLSMTSISTLLRLENLNLPGGSVEKGDKNLLVRSIGEFESVKEISDLPIILPNGSKIYLNDIAEVSLIPKEITKINELDGKQSVSINIFKQSGYNTVDVADKVNNELSKLEGEIEGVRIENVFDQSTYIKKSIQNVSKSGLIGGVLAILVLYLFLRNIRSTFIIGISIPVSIIATFSLIFFSGITLNLMTLGGLALGMGMLVDNSIVVLENIYRFRQAGYSRIDAAKDGAGEVGMAVIASTLTTVAVFLPIVFVEGITSIIFRELALTITFALLSSLVIALTVVPMLSSKILKITCSEKKEVKSRIKIFKAFDKTFSNVEGKYRALLKKAIGHKLLTIAVALVIFIGSIFAVVQVGAEFLPSTDEGRISISIELPTGAKLEKTRLYVDEVEELIKDIPEIDTIFASIGGGNSFISSGSQSNYASLDLALMSLADRESSSDYVADEIRKLLADIPGANIQVQAVSSQGGGMGMGSSPISIRIQGDELEVLKGISKDFVDILNSIEGTREVASSFEEGLPEVQVRIKRETASQYGITSYQIAQTIRDNLSGVSATKYKVDGNEIDVMIESVGYLKDNINNFRYLQIKSPMGVSVPLEQIAEIFETKGPVSINRIGQVRTVSVTSDIIGRDLASIVSDIEAQTDNYFLEDGYSFEVGGQNEDLVESFKSLFLALILAIFLVYMILASQFESLLYPFIIMFTVPLAFSGGALGLFLTGRTLSVPSVIGFLMLSGIVVNNAIVMIDYVNILRRKGHDVVEAILIAGPTRLRPILMTSLTTILALMPIAVATGEGAEIQSPLATVVIGGLLLSTLLTLVLIPVMYLVMDGFSTHVKKWFNRKKDKEEPCVE